MSEALSKLEQQIEPVVISRAHPEPAELLQARADVQSHESLQELFKEGLPPSELATRLTAELRKIWPDGDPADAAQFLADEYDQIGPKGVQLINTETGRIAAIIGEDDIYQPAPVPREGSNTLAQPLPRIRPDLESAIITWFHDKGREERIVEALAKRGHQTALLRELGDPRLLVATRRGRKHIVDSLAKIEPQVLLEAAGGTAGAFLRRFSFEVPEGDLSRFTHIEGTVASRSVMGIQDMHTTNLRYNRPESLKGALVQGWVRELARCLVREATLKRPLHGFINVQSWLSLPHSFWVAPPEVVRPFRTIDPKVLVLPVESSRTVALQEGSLGYLKVPQAFQAFNREIFDRWEAGAALDFEMWVDLEKVLPFDVVGIEEPAQVL